MMAETPISERPRERCLQSGAPSLSLRECLAVILGSGPPRVGCLGLARQILEPIAKDFNPAEEERAFFTALEASGKDFLAQTHGLGPAGQARILAAFELGRRYSRFREQARRPPRGATPPRLDQCAVRALDKIPEQMRSHAQEWLGFVPFYRTGELGNLCVVENGTRTHVNTDPAELFSKVLSLRPQGFFLFHNHPSGETRPSPQDIQLTQAVSDLATALGIRLFGHWIVTAESEHWISPSGSC